MAELSGWGDLERFFKRAPEVVADALESGLVIEANEMMTASKEETPVDMGTLRGSGTVFPAERELGGVSVELGYGGAAADYAVPVHERLGVAHPVGKAKFLEEPVLTRAPRLGPVLAKELARALTRLGR